jgi:hypothetical protein
MYMAAISRVNRVAKETLQELVIQMRNIGLPDGLENQLKVCEDIWHRREDLIDVFGEQRCDCSSLGRCL